MAVYQDGYIKYIRERVGHELIYLVYTTGIVLNDDNHILVQQRHEFDWWDLVGGAKELGETIQDCMIREIKEESGLDVKIERMVGIYTHPDYTIQYPHGDWVQPWTVCFVCRKVGGQIKPDGKETLRAEFKPLDEILPHPYILFNKMLRDAFMHEDTSQLVLEAPYTHQATKPYFPILRQHIKQDPIILPGAIVFAQNDAGEILVTKRRALQVWDFPGGFCDLGESVTHTAIREIREETGLEIELIRPLGVYSDPAFMAASYPNGDQVQAVGQLFQAKIVGGTLKADGDENIDAAFLSPEVIGAQPDLRPLTKQLLTDIAHLDQAPFIR